MSLAAGAAETEPDARPLLIAGALLILLAFVLLIVGLVRAYMGRKKADEAAAAHFEVQIRTFWLGALYTAVPVGLAALMWTREAAELVAWIAWVSVDAWFVMRCIKGLECLHRQEPYPNPRTWLW